MAGMLIRRLRAPATALQRVQALRQELLTYCPLGTWETVQLWGLRWAVNPA
jgi:hypothetical protein